MRLSLPKQLSRFVLSPGSIVLIDIFLGVLGIEVFLDVVNFALGQKADFKYAIEGVSGLATMFVGYGVVVESRADLMRIGGLYPALDSDYQHRIDGLCHDYGLLFLVVALLLEVSEQLLLLPNDFVNTAGFERGTCVVLSALFFILLVLLVRHSLGMGWLALRRR